MPREFSWILPNHLAVGSFPGRTSAFYLREHGVTAVLSLTEPHEGEIPHEVSYSFVWRRLEIPDGARGGIPTIQHFEEGVTVLQRWRQKKNVLFVHCLAGIGRSTSMCIAYLCHTQNMTFEEAFTLVTKTHAIARPDEHQVRILQEYLSKCDPGLV